MCVCVCVSLYQDYVCWHLLVVTPGKCFAVFADTRRSTPGAGDMVAWKEGVGIVLDKRATAAWR